MVTIECESIEEGLLKVAQHLGSEILTEGSRNLVDGSHVDTGQLLQSGELVNTQQGCVVKWSLNYADFVEYGSDPHWTPIEPLLAWARRKGMDEGFAYAVQRKIAKEGTDPVAYARNGIDAVIRKYSG